MGANSGVKRLLALLDFLGWGINNVGGLPDSVSSSGLDGSGI